MSKYLRLFVILGLMFVMCPASEAAGVAHTASGTYTWNATTGVITRNVTSSDFTCDGPTLGAGSHTGVTVTATTMTWANDTPTTWTRSSGTAGDIVGTWTSADSTTGNSWTLTYNANGTGSFTGVIVSCSGGGGGGAGTGTHTASGTSTWNATTGVSTTNWTSSDFTCAGPSVGTQIQTGVTITATTMTIPKDNMTWTRPGGTAGDGTGTWTFTDSTTGNSYTLTVTANGTVSLSANIVSCGVYGGQNPAAYSQHWQNGYYVDLEYSDPSRTATAVNVTGPGITGSEALTYDAVYGSWNSWTLPSPQVFFGATYPALPYTYTFTITPSTGAPATATSTVSCFQPQLPTPLSPTGTVTGTGNPTFSWTGISDPSPVYGLELHDNTGNQIWSSFNITGTSFVYNGPALTLGTTYTYYVSVQSSGACSNGQSLTQSSFTYGNGGANTGTGMHTASGTYAWNATTGVITKNWTSSDFTCDGPPMGAGTITGVAITATTMTWANGNTWARSSGTAGNVVGTWTATDSSTENSSTLTVNANGTVSLTANIVSCGGYGGQNPSASSRHWSDGYYVHFQYDDSPQTASSVSVTGPGITGSLSLTYDANHSSWNSLGYNFFIGTTSPTGLPFTYTFSITDATGTPTIATSTVSCFQPLFATNLSPTGSVTGNPTFSWTGISDTSATYNVELRDNNIFYWNSGNISGTSSILYYGPALTLGTTYTYYVSVQSSSACINGQSLTQGSFTYGSGGAGTGVSQFDGTYTGSWSVTCPACGDTAAGTFTATLVNGVFTNSILNITSGTHGPRFDSGTVSSSGAITATGATPTQCSSSVSTLTGQITTTSGGAGMTMTYSRPASPEGCAAESGTITATRTATLLTVAKSGSGSGTITSNPTGIDCGATCSAPFNIGGSATLTATPASGSTFAGWSGDCAGTGACTLAMSAAKNVTAIFVPIGFTLNVNSSGASNVQIGSSPASYAGSTSYSMTGIASGTSITLTAPEKSGNASFARWTGCDSSSGLTCTVTMNAAKSVTASYAATPYTLSVTPGSGIVTSSSGSINCGGSGNICSASFNSGTRVTLTATSAKDYLFDGWNGCDTSTKTNNSTGSCTVSIDAVKTVQPLFHYAAAVNAVTQGTNSDGTITAPIATVTTTISFNPPDVGKTVQVYVTALVPARLLGPSASKQSAARNFHAMAAATSNALVLIQLTSSGWQQVVNGQLIPYTTGVLGDQISAITVLNNTSTANLGGSQICVGYGTSASEMTSAGRMQLIATVPDPNAANTNTGSCNVTTPISEARVFAYAETNYANLFAGTAMASQYLQYDYRYYPASKNYLAVDTSGVIFILGPVSGNVITSVGPVESFRSVITDWEAAL